MQTLWGVHIPVEIHALVAGRIVLEGPAKKFAGHPHVRMAYLGL
jgi:ABC-type branched-subunit amino acid transport system ATPase component